MENNEVIQKILRDYDLLKARAFSKRDEEVKKAYIKAPQLEEIDKLINEVGFESMKLIMKRPQDSQKIKQDLETKLFNLKEERDEIIKKFDIDPNYNKPVYKCSLCSDTGYIENKRCSCFEKKLILENEKSSNMGNMIKNIDFSMFNLDYYDDKDKGIIKEALQCAKSFCNDFDNINYNLFFYGNTGLGKTYLSSIIANEVLKNSKSVIYVRATKMFSDYEDYRFNDYSLKENINNLYRCDLLVIDDLGSESTNKQDVSFLFDLLNDRILNNKKTIINTNLEISDFTKLYSVRLTSRIYENFKIFKFSGDDIRIKKLIKK